MVTQRVKDGRLFVKVDVTNTGGMYGEEVVQVYVSFPDSEVPMPWERLCAFDRDKFDN